MATARTAERVEPGTGIRQVVGFAGEDVRLFTARHEPVVPTGGGVLLCSSIFVEALRMYRMEVELARALAGRGLAAQRFHYRGSGHSDGESVDMSWSGMVDDAARTVTALTDDGGARRLAFVGTRFGGLVAAACAAGVPGAPLVLIEPVLDGGRFFQEGLRADKVAGLRSATAASGRSMADLLAQFDRTGRVDLLGYDLGRALFDSASGLKLLDLLGSGAPRPVLIVQLGEPDMVKVPIAHFADALLEAGFAVEVHRVGEAVGWWFEADEDRPDDRITVPVAEWLEAHLGDSAPSADRTADART